MTVSVTPASYRHRSALQQVPRHAPLKGLNLADPITATPDGHAIRLENWICRRDGLHVRPGYRTVGRLMGALRGAPITHIAGLGQRVFACSPCGLHDSDGRVIASGQSMIPPTSAVIANSGGRHLIMSVGGGLHTFDGLTWRAGHADGAGAAALTAHHGRLFAVEHNTLNLWHFARGAIRGEASRLPLSALFPRGGSIVALASVGAAQSPARQLAIVTSVGEVAIYAGTDPGDIANWTLTGVHQIPEPVGGRCAASVGGSLAVLTVDGLVTVGAPTAPGQSLPALSALIDPQLTREIAGGPRTSAETGRYWQWQEVEHEMWASQSWPWVKPGFTCERWQVLDSASSQALVVAGPSGQWTKSSAGAWSRWTIPGVTCWHEADDRTLWFGTIDGRICRMTADAFEDDGEPISAYAVGSFSRPSASTRRFARVRPHYRLAHPYKSRVEVLVDWRNPPTDFAAAYANNPFWMWAEMAADMWGADLHDWERQQSPRMGVWRGVSGRGSSHALMLGIKTRGPVVWTGYDLEFKEDGR